MSTTLRLLRATFQHGISMSGITLLRTLPAGHHATRSATRLIVWCLLIALPVYGFSGSLALLLGSTHLHRDGPVSATAAPEAVLSRAELLERVAARLPAESSGLEGWVDFRRVVPIRGHAEHVADTAPSAAAAAHAHAHRTQQRHHHAFDDPTVIALDAGAHDAPLPGDDGSTAGAGTLFVPVTPAAAVLAPAGAQACPCGFAPRFASRESRRLERPPRA